MDCESTREETRHMSTSDTRAFKDILLVKKTLLQAESKRLKKTLNAYLKKAEKKNRSRNSVGKQYFKNGKLFHNLILPENSFE